MSKDMEKVNKRIKKLKKRQLKKNVKRTNIFIDSVIDELLRER